MRVDFEHLFAAAARLSALDGAADSEIGDGFVAMLRALVPFDYSVVFAYRGNERPVDLFSTFDEAEYFIFVSLYQEGAYLLDPFFSAAMEPRPGIWRMRELAPDRFFASEYYRGYYAKTGLSEEIGYFEPMADGTTVVLSLMRKESAGPFRPTEYELLRKASPFVRGLMHRLWGGVADRFDARKTDGTPPEPPGFALGHATASLTARERSIVELVLQGHSSESIGLKLGVATGTVKVHRRNIYRKLGISSQTQLMSLYLESLKPGERSIV